MTSTTEYEFSTSKVTHNSLTLPLGGHSGNWWLKQTEPSTGTCTTGESNFSHALSGLTVHTTYTYKACSKDGCNRADEIASRTFTTSRLVVSNVTYNSATLTIHGLSNYNWWLKRTSPQDDTTCINPGSTHTHTLSALTSGTQYTYTAYSDDSCSNAIADGVTTFTVKVRFEALQITRTGATLKLTDYTGAWWIKRTAPTEGNCTSGESDHSHALTNLTLDTTYTYGAYSDSQCSVELNSVTFATLAEAVSNLNQALSTWPWVGHNDGSDRLKAQGFTTGSNSGGYTLSRVIIRFGFDTVGTPANIQVTVTLHAADTNDASKPASQALATLSGSNPTTAGNYAYTCATGCALEPSTTYFIKVDAPGSGNGNYYRMAAMRWSSVPRYELQLPSWSLETYGLVGSRCNPDTWNASNQYGYPMQVRAAPELSLTAGGITTTTATLTLGGYPHNWWLKQTAPSTGNCAAGEADFSHALSSLTAGQSHTHKAYSDSSCIDANEIASRTFSTAVSIHQTGGWFNTAEAGWYLTQELSNGDTRLRRSPTGSHRGGYTLSSAVIEFGNTTGSPGNVAGDAERVGHRQHQQPGGDCAGHAQRPRHAVVGGANLHLLGSGMPTDGRHYLLHRGRRPRRTQRQRQLLPDRIPGGCQSRYPDALLATAGPTRTREEHTSATPGGNSRGLRMKLTVTALPK